MANDRINQVIEFNKKWYSGLRMPAQMLSGAFAQFAASNALANEVLEDALSQVKLLVDDFQTGFTNGEVVGLPMWYFAPASFDEWADEKDARFLSLACLNGTLVHEFLHVVHSTLTDKDNLGDREDPIRNIDIEAVSRLDNTAYEYFVDNPRFFSKVFNVVEDIYIESTTEGTVLRKILQNKNEILLPLHNLDKLSNMPSLHAFDVMNALISMKNLAAREHEVIEKFPLLEEALEILLQADANGKQIALSERARISGELADFLTAHFDDFENKDEEGGENQKGSGDSEEGQEQRKSDVDSDGDDSQGGQGSEVDGQDAEIDWAAFEDNEGQEGKEKFYQNAENFERAKARQIANEFQKAAQVKDYDAVPVDVITLEQAIDEKLVERSHRKYPPQIQEEADMTKLARALKFRDRTHKLSAPTRSGPRLQTSRLPRHKFDNKMFGHRNKVMKKEPEIIILIDGSGSMRWTLMEKALATAKALHDNLGEIPHLIVADTNRKEPNKDVGLITKIQGSRMGYTSSLSRPFATMMGMWMNYTPAGITLREAAKLFTNRANNKVMIVISDGRPNMPTVDGFTGEKAKDYTREKVNEIRKSGKTLIALSITNSAEVANDDIYGKDWNIKAEASNMDMEIQRVISNVIKAM